MRLLEALFNIFKAYLRYRGFVKQVRTKGPQGMTWDALEKGDYQMAFQMGTNLNDDFIRGTALMNLGEFAEAEKSLRRSVEKAPNPKLAAVANIGLGELYTHQLRYEKAVECFQNALILWPERGSTHREFAEVWLRRGDGPAEALRRARLAVESERAGGGMPEAKNANLCVDLATLAWAEAVNSRDAAEVEKLSAEAVSLYGATPVSYKAQVHCHCGLAYATLGDAVKSKQHFEEAARVDPNGMRGREAMSMAAGVPK